MANARSLWMLVAGLIAILCAQIACATAAGRDQAVGADRLDDPLPAGARMRLGSTRLRHLQAVRAVAFAPDGKLLASCSWWEQTISLWDMTAEGKEVLHHHSALWATHLTFSPDGQTLAARGALLSSLGSALWQFNPRTGKELATEANHPLTVGAAFSPDGRHLAVATALTGVSLWSVKTQERVSRFEDKEAGNLAFAPDGKTIIYTRQSEKPGPGDSDLFFWDPQANRIVRRVPVPGGMVSDLALSPDGKTFAALTSKELILWNAATWEISLRLPDVEVWAFAATANQVAIVENHRLVLLNVANAKQEKSWPLPKETTCLACSPDGKLFAARDQHGMVHVLDASSGEPKWPRPRYGGPVRAVMYAPDGKTLAGYAADVKLALWETTTGRQASLLIQPPAKSDEDLPPADRQRPVHPLAFTGKTQLAWGDHHGMVHLVDTAAGKITRSWKAHAHPVLAVDVAPNGQSLATAARDEAILWNAADGKKLEQVFKFKVLPQEALPRSRFAKDLHSLRFTPDGKHLLAGYSLATSSQFGGGGSSNPVHSDPSLMAIRDLSTTKQRLAVLGSSFHGSADDVKQSFRDCIEQRVVALDGKHVVSRGVLHWGTFRLWEVPSEKLVFECNDSQFGAIGGMAISPDGRFLAVGYGLVQTPNEGCVVCLWEIATGKVAWQRRGHRAAITSVAFAPDGKTLATGSADTTILLWDLAPADLDVKLLAAKWERTDMDKLWADLASSDAAVGYHAAWMLASRPQQALILVAARFESDKPVTQPWIDQRIADLDSDDFTTRQQAETSLWR